MGNLKDIYVIKNNRNNKAYVGQSDNPMRRWMTYMWNSSGMSEGLQLIERAIKKHGICNFTFQIVEKGVENFNERESYWISFFNSKTPYGYNVGDGGAGHGVSTKNPLAKINEDQLNAIYHDLLYSDIPMNQLSKKIGYDSASVISEINHGKRHRREGYEYPLRECSISEPKFKRLVYSIKHELEKTFDEIADEYNIKRGSMHHINKGLIHRRDWVSYPIRSREHILDTNKKYQLQLAVKEMLLTTMLTFEEIAKKAGCGKHYVYKLNRGERWFDSSLQYPLRGTKLTDRKKSRTLSETDVREIEVLLKTTHMSINEIGKKYDVSSSLINNVNNGVVKKYYNKSLKYPIRIKSKPVSTS